MMEYHHREVGWGPKLIMSEFRAPSWADFGTPELATAGSRDAAKQMGRKEAWAKKWRAERDAGRRC